MSFWPLTSFSCRDQNETWTISMLTSRRKNQNCLLLTWKQFEVSIRMNSLDSHSLMMISYQVASWEHLLLENEFFTRLGYGINVTNLFDTIMIQLWYNCSPYHLFKSPPFKSQAKCVSMTLLYSSLSSIAEMNDEHKLRFSNSWKKIKNQLQLKCKMMENMVYKVFKKYFEKYFKKYFKKLLI